MTVEIAYAPITVAVTAGGTQTAVFSWEYRAVDDIVVTLNGTVLTASTHYTVTPDAVAAGAIPEGGTVTPVGSWSEAGTLIVERVTPNTQAINLVTTQRPRIQETERGLDYGVLRLQERDEEARRTLTAPVGDTASSLVFPGVSDRASKILAFDATGQPIAGSALPSTTVSGAATNGETLVWSDTAGAYEPGLVTPASLGNVITAATTWTVDNDVATGGTNFATLAEAVTEAHRWRIALSGSLTISVDADDHTIASPITIDHPDGQRLSIVGATSAALATGSLNNGTTTIGGTPADRAAGYAYMRATMPTRLVLSAGANITVHGPLNLDHLMIDGEATTLDCLVLLSANLTISTRLAAGKSTQTAGRCVYAENSYIAGRPQIATVGGSEGLVSVTSDWQLNSLDCHVTASVDGIYLFFSSLSVIGDVQTRGCARMGLNVVHNSTILANNIVALYNNFDGGLLVQSSIGLGGQFTAQYNLYEGVKCLACTFRVSATWTSDNGGTGQSFREGSSFNIPSVTSYSNVGWGFVVHNSSGAGTVNSIHSNTAGAVQGYWGSLFYMLSGTITGTVSPAVNTFGNGASYIAR